MITTLLWLLLLPCLAKAETINDFSQLNKTTVAHIFYPTSATEIQQIIRKARQTGRTVSIAGKRHSQGRHAFWPNAYVIDITKFNKILSLDTQAKTITVQPGATWEHIQEYINPHGLAIKVMQTAEIFTIGGSLSVNAHGRDPNYGPLIETVQSFKIVLASGRIVTASRTQNYELFKLAIGGYGLFGVIVEATLSLTDNVVYRKKSKIIRVKNYEKFVQNNVIGRPEVGLHYGIICLAPYNFFKKVLVVNYEQFTPNKRQARTVYKLHKEEFVELGKLGMELKRHSKIVNRISDWTGWPFMVMEETAGHTTCRNNAMRHPVAFLEHEATCNTDVLQSYFIPPHNFVAFMEYLATCAHSKDLQIFFALTRYIPKNTESFLAYTKENYFEIVLFINHGTNTASLAHAERWTQATVDKILALGGNYYLPVRLNQTKAQLKQAYPQIDLFFTKKRYYDPDELFMNGLYAKYRN